MYSEILGGDAGQQGDVYVDEGGGGGVAIQIWEGLKNSEIILGPVLCIGCDP